MKIQAVLLPTRAQWRVGGRSGEGGKWDPWRGASCGLLSQEGGGGDGAGNPVDAETCVRLPSCSVVTVNSSEWDCWAASHAQFISHTRAKLKSR